VGPSRSLRCSASAWRCWRPARSASALVLDQRGRDADAGVRDADRADDLAARRRVRTASTDVIWPNGRAGAVAIGHPQRRGTGGNLPERRQTGKIGTCTDSGARTRAPTAYVVTAKYTDLERDQRREWKRSDGRPGPTISPSTSPARPSRGERRQPDDHSQGRSGASRHHLCRLHHSPDLQLRPPASPGGTVPTVANG